MIQGFAWLIVPKVMLPLRGEMAARTSNQALD